MRVFTFMRVVSGLRVVGKHCTRVAMTKWAYYNEVDQQKSAWIRELIKAKVVTDGEVDQRDIRLVAADDVRGFRRVHWFAGIGVWDYALNLAGWEDREVWTGSCPCPSFSAAGKGFGFADSRHLWPEWNRLICECRPGTIFGEQVAAAIGHGWLDLVSTDLEAQEYAVAAAVLGAHSVGAPHIRQRLYFCAHAATARCGEGRSVEAGNGGAARLEPSGLCDAGNGSNFNGRLPSHGDLQRSGEQRLLAGDYGTGELLYADSSRCETQRKGGKRTRECKETGLSSPTGGHGDTAQRVQPMCGSASGIARHAALTGSTRGFWADCDWWYGRDGKWRPIEPGVFPLAHGASNRVFKLRGYGDAIIPQVAEAFIRSATEALF